MRDLREDNYGEKQEAAMENPRKAASQEPPTLMSEEDYRRSLQGVLERLRDEGRLDAIPRSDHQVKQLLELAYTNVERTAFC